MATTLYPGIPFSPQATLTNNIGAADSIIEVSDVSAFPPAPNLATIGTDEEGETILYTAKTETALSGCQRGIEGDAKAWKAGEIIGRNFTAKDHNDLINIVQELLEAGPWLPLNGGTINGDIIIPYGHKIRFMGLCAGWETDLKADSSGALCIGPNSQGIVDFGCVSGTLCRTSILRSVSTPSQDFDAANKRYVDGMVGDIAHLLDNINGEVV